MLARVRISVPDRPGALGRVASAIGSGAGDIAQVDVLESAAGRALDDVVVQVGDAAHLDRVTRALAELPGVTLVGVQVPAVAGHGELELVRQVLARPSRALRTLADGAPAALGADWAAVLAFEPDGGQREVVALSTAAPDPAGIAVRAPLRLTTLPPPRGAGGTPGAGAVLVPLDGSPLGLLLVRERGLDFHSSEVWRLGTLDGVLGPAVAAAQPVS